MRLGDRVCSRKRATSSSEGEMTRSRPTHLGVVVPPLLLDLSVRVHRRVCWNPLASHSGLVEGMLPSSGTTLSTDQKKPSRISRGTSRHLTPNKAAHGALP